ncbi:RNA-directed DNA polymerase, eukaryota [Tanacetum coccineum]
MGTFRSKEDDVAKISISVFVTNFPDSISSKDLFNACKQYGHVVDSFIATKRSKAGKRFALHKLHANVARFSRVSEKNPNKTFVSSKPSCLVSRDFDNFVMGEIKDFSAINNLRVLLANEGFLNVKLAYIGGLWVMIELDSTSTKEKFMQHAGVAYGLLPLQCSRGFVSRLEENKEDMFARKRICIKTSREDNILERFKITIRGKIYMIRAKELFMWSPIFKEPANTGYNSDKDADVGDHEINDNGNDYRNLEEESDIEAVSDTVFGDSIDNNTGEQKHSTLSATKEESCLVSRDFDNFVMGEIKDFSAINNLRVLLANEGFLNVKLAYIGGLWVMIELDSTSTKEKFMQHVGVASWFARLCNAQEDFVSRERIVWVDIEGVPLRAWSQSTFKKIGAKWGEVMKLEENKEDMFARKRICIKTSREDNILERFKITIRGKIYMIRAKELFMWSPIFKEPANTGYNSDKDADVGDHEINDNGNDYRNLEEESDIEAVSDTVFGDSIDNNTGEQEHSNLSATKEGSYDPFNIYDLLNKQQVEDNKSDNSISHPPGFTPVNVEDSKHRDRQEGSASSKSRTSEFCSRVVEEAQAVDDNPSPVPNAINKRSKTGGSILDLLDELIKVGNTMGYSLDGCAKDLENIIGLQGECDVPI